MTYAMWPIFLAERRFYSILKVILNFPQVQPATLRALSHAIHHKAPRAVTTCTVLPRLPYTLPPSRLRGQEVDSLRKAHVPSHRDRFSGWQRRYLSRGSCSHELFGKYLRVVAGKLQSPK